MKKFHLTVIGLFLILGQVYAQSDVTLTDFFLSVGYKNQPFSALNQRLVDNGLKSFNANVGTLGGGFSYLPQSGWGFFAETELNVNKKGYSNAQVSYRYLPVHVTAGVQYHLFRAKIGDNDWSFYPKLGLVFGTTSLDLVSNNPNRDFDENLLGSMNTSFLYQENYGINISLNADKLLGSFMQPTTQVGIYSRMGFQIGYMLNVFSSRTKLRRNFNPTIRNDFSMSNSPEFNPSAFYVKFNFAIGKFTKRDSD
ncbi:MAG TPA: hypothetical protein VK014_15035 [Cyclobacteriaceae bacterium]|nr:hypothetical protein [Cyclobacteriaceae bacterium]